MDTNELKERVEWLIKARLYVVSILTIVGITQALILAPERYLELLKPVSLLVLFVLLCNLLYSTILKKQRWTLKNLIIFIYIQIIFDVTATTALIHFSGGIESSYFIVYLFLIFAAGMLLYPISTYIIATLSTILYGMLLLLEHYGVISTIMIFDFQLDIWKPGVIISTFVSRAGSFYITAFFSDYISRILEKKTRELEKSSQLKELFISILVHDLKNMLHLISGYAQIIRKTRNMEHAKKIEETVKRMDRIIDNVKLYSKLREKEYKEKFETENLYKIIKRSTEFFEDRRKIEIQCKDKNYFVKASPTLENVFYNLIDNAVKYSEKKIEITI
ncbi:MAG: HAMP domain-containing histidine kinase, partial [Methanomicrobia archaeon]|nr:HAMP domain-containing histidine kinase [Methanomicrobia archaeon]